MQHKCKLTVIDKKLYPELQRQFCADKESGPCPCYNIGDEFVFDRYGGADNFWRMGLNTLRSPSDGPDETAGGTAFPHCSEAWDAISRYIYAALQGGSIMRGWMEDERVMIACCSDGTRPVIFKIQRLDYKALYIDGAACGECREKLTAALRAVPGVSDVEFRRDYAEVYLDKPVDDAILTSAVAGCGGYSVTKID